MLVVGWQVIQNMALEMEITLYVKTMGKPIEIDDEHNDFQ